MNEIIYLEPDEDITGAISRAKAAASAAVCFVVPRGGTISQSVVNLKLLKREVEKIGKTISLVSKDKISKNLASQVGITVYPSANEAKNAHVHSHIENDQAEEKPSGFSTSGLRVNQYKRDGEEKQAAAEEALAEQQSDSPPAWENPAQFVDDSLDESIDTGESALLEDERSKLAHAEPMPKKVVEEPVKNIVVGQQALSKNPTPKKNLSSRKKPAIIIASIFVVVLLAAVVVLMPSAQANVTLTTEDIEVSSPIVADKTIAAADSEGMKVPAKYYEILKESEKQFPSTGSKDVGTKASGEISFYNNYDPQNSVTVPEGATLTANGKSFVIEAAVNIPPATVVSLYPTKINPGVAKGKIVAKEPGESYNLAATNFVITSFSGVKQEKVYAQSNTPLAGGTTKEVKVVTKKDIDDAKKVLENELDTAIKSEISSQAQMDGIKLVSSSINSAETEFYSDKAADEESDLFTLKLKLKITELGYSEVEVQNLMLSYADNDLEGNEMFVNPNIEQVSYDIKSVDVELGQVSMLCTFKGKVGKKIEASQIREMLKGSKYGTAEAKIEAIEGVNNASISIKPSFWPLLPMLQQRIFISFDYQKDESQAE